MRDREDETRRAYGDAIYDAWRAGRNPDAVDYERVREDVYSGMDRYEASEVEVERLTSPPQPTRRRCRGGSMNDRRRRLAGDMNFQMAAHRAALPHHEEPERAVDEWEDGLRYKLTERGGIFRLYTWNLYRWEISEAGLQAVARRIADLHREENVVPMIRRKR